MFEFLKGSSSGEDAISLIKQDHDKVKDLFDQFEKAETLARKKKIVAEAILELKVHAALEEEIFYPAVRKSLGKKIMTEADEEHHVAKILIAELETMTGREEHYDAKFTVLAENVRHHIKEEEGEMLPKAKSTSADMDVLGKKMLTRKQQLLKQGVGVLAEEMAIKKAGGIHDSSAQAAKKAPSKTSAAKKPAASKKPATRTAKTVSKTAAAKAKPKSGSKKTATKTKATKTARKR